LFVYEVLNANPEPYQAEILRQIASGERRIAVRSGHGVGKTTTLAWAIVWHLCTKFPQKTVCTAPTTKQLYDALAAETKSWMRKLPVPVLQQFDIQVEHIKFVFAPEESFVSFRVSKAETPEALAGVHSDNVLLICDEASGIPEAVYEAAAGSMSGHSACTVLAGNPVRTNGLFFDAFHKLRDMWHCTHISCLSSARVTPDFIEDMKRRYGEDSNGYRVRVLGDFPLADDDTLIAQTIAPGGGYQVVSVPAAGGAAPPPSAGVPSPSLDITALLAAIAGTALAGLATPPPPTKTPTLASQLAPGP